MTMNRVRCPWTGIATGPGVSTFYFGSGTTSMTALVTFLNAIATFIPTGINIQVPNLGDQINETDGKIVGSWTGSGGGSANGFATAANYAAQSGMCIDWLTSLILDGRRRQGRTFFVPLANSAFQNDGTLGTAFAATALTAATNFIAAYAGEFKVFVRPVEARAAKPDNIPPLKERVARAGAAGQVIVARVPDFAATLRSRRQ